MSATRQMTELLKTELFLQQLRREIANSNNLEGEKSIWKDAGADQIFCALATSRGQIELMVETYHTWKNVIGYGLPHDAIIRVNRKYLDIYRQGGLTVWEVTKIGSNLLHEHGHDCGFSHDFFATKRRKNSICYILNQAYEKTAIEYYEIKPKVFAPKPWWKVW
jgi:hypothetical protein